MSDETSPRAWQLIAEYANDQLQNEGVGELQSLLLNDAALLRDFVLYMELHARVVWSKRALRDASSAASDAHFDALIAPPVQAEFTDGEAPTTNRFRLLRMICRPTPLSWAAATVVMAVVVTAMSFMVPPVYRAMRQSMATSESAEPAFVATLQSTFEAEWADGQIGTQRGAKWEPGHDVKLTSGFAEITFHRGASIVVEGPAHLTIGDDLQATLVRGRLVARVSAAAQGFTIATAQGQIVDLGTEFAVDVDPQRDVEVHVIEGSVELRGASGPSPSAIQVLSAGSAAKFRREAGQMVVTPIDYKVGGFTRRAPLADDEWTADSPLPVGRALSLWLSADHGVVCDSQGRVAIWKDRLTGDNRHAENALQIEATRRPTLNTNGIGGQPALVFDGRTTNLITSPRVASGEQTIFLVAAPHRFAGRPGVQLLNTGSSPNFAVDFSAKGEVIARSFDGKRNHPALTSRVVELRAPVLIAFTHSQSAKQAQLWVNGQAQGTNSASPATFGEGRLFLGSHGAFSSFFDGQLAEVIIFDTALTDEELQLVTNYFREKYTFAW